MPRSGRRSEGNPRWAGGGALAAAVVVALGACSESAAPPPVPAALTKVSGDLQTGPVGTALTTPVAVQVNDLNARPVGGAPVTFTVTLGGGTVSPSQMTTGADGRAATTWTLGTTAGSPQELRAVTVGTASPVTFRATAVAGPAATLSRVSGDAQQGSQGAPLASPLVVRVADGFGNAVASHAVTFAVVSGGGSVNPAVATTGGDGQATTTWTLGASGPQAAEARAPGLAGSPVPFTATAVVLALNAVAPDTLVEGQTATLAGEGFDPVPGNNTVTVGGTAATVTAASSTSLQIQVPSFDCRPARDVEVRVTVGGVATGPVVRRLHPASFLALGVGEQRIVRDPAGFCLQFRASAAGGEAYLVGVGAAAEQPGATLPFTLTASVGSSAAGAASEAVPAPVDARAVPGTSFDETSLELALSHARVEAALRRRERAFLSRTLSAGREALQPLARSPLSPAVVPAVGDTLRFRVPDISATDFCSTFREILTTVRVVGMAGIWVTDNNKPGTDTLTNADLQAFSTAFDTYVYAVDTLYFGRPSDVDTNQRVIVVLTQEVNRFAEGVAGFTFSGDLVPRSSCASSDQGEVFYGHVPDPTGSVGSVRTKASVVARMPPLIAHEVTHIIQFARRLFDPTATTFQQLWEMEGQATLAEEVVGHRVLGNTVGADYGSSVANTGGGLTWYQPAFIRLAYYYGWQGGSSRAATAPELCSLFASFTSTVTTPCLSSHFYGAAFSFQRYVSDRFGPTYPGGEAKLHRDWIGKSPTLDGVRNVEALLGVGFDSLFAQWAAMLYVDGRVPGAPAALLMTSWNLFDVFNGLNAALRLTPVERTFANFTDSRSVRGGSTAYTRISSAGARSATAVRVRDTAGGILAATLRPHLWVVRLQ